MTELADKLRNKTLTVGEALDLAVKDAPESRIKNIKSFGNKLKKLGIEDASPFTSIGEAANLELLAKEKGQPFAALTTVQNAINGAAAAQDIENPFPDYSAKAQSAGLIAGKQLRGTKKFEAVPEAKITLPAIVETISKVEDPQTRAALSLNSLVPLRPGEIANMTLDDINLETGMLKEKVRGQKTQAKIKIPGVALEIIRDAAELAEQEGRTNIFDTTVSKMTTAINAPGGLRDQLKPYASEMGREIQGAADFRKLIPSIIAMELGYAQEASEIMGHTSASQTLDSVAKMSSEHYVSRILRQGEEARPTIALRALQNMYGEVLGLETLNELPASLNVSAKRIELSNEAIPIVREEGDILAPSERRELTPEEKQLIEDRRKLASTQIEAQTAQAGADIEAAETARQQAIVERGPISEDAARIKVQEQETTNQARRNLREQKKAETAAAEKQQAREDVKGFFKRANEALSKLPPPVKKAIPIVGTTASLFAADAKRQEAMAAAEEGRPIVAALRGAQAVEEVVSPLPFTTGDVEDLVVTERTPQEEEFLRAQRETRAERMGARRERAASAQMDALMSK
jgi:integrase